MEKDILATLKLAAPARRALASAGIKTLKQLSQFSEGEIAELHGIGKNALQTMKQSLKTNGWSFSPKK